MNVWLGVYLSDYSINCWPSRWPAMKMSTNMLAKYLRDSIRNASDKRMYSQMSPKYMFPFVNLYEPLYIIINKSSAWKSFKDK